MTIVSSDAYLEWTPIPAPGGRALPSTVVPPLAPTGRWPSPPPLGDRHRLVVWLGDAVASWRLPQSGQVVVGRAQDADIKIEFFAISRRHARITIEQGSVRLADLDSQNGTRVNGERLTEERALVYGDIINFGEIRAVFSADREVDDPATPAAQPLAEAPVEEQLLEFGGKTVMVADSAMVHVYTQLARLAQSDISVLVRGETGTGKELAATALHFWSKRWEKPLVTINCAALPETLAESELFGHVRGAFSGAATDKPGLLESGNGGTVLLDEIGDLSLPVQGKLLRVLETRRLTRLGSVSEREVDIRIVAATHRDLDRGVKERWFRQDLFYRLNVALVVLPPLRLRKREMPLLARRFLKQACSALGRAAPPLSDAAWARLCAHDWPGNVRELKNLMDYLAATSPADSIRPEHFKDRLIAGAAPDDPPPPSSSSVQTARGMAPAVADGPVRSLAESVTDHERASIEAALVSTGGNKTRAAKLLGVPLRTFMQKIKRHGIR
ncbi:MAG TPA: sigma 54-interacting transcriptional regulator [Polyangia bacterium]